MVRPVLLVPVIVLLLVNGLRDKIIFRAARGEQYLPAVVFMATLGEADLVIALKLLIVVVWVGAGFSKIGEHFINVVPPMVSNAPFNPFKWVKRLHYRDAPNDLLPSRFAWVMAHIGGTFVEVVVPLILLFTTNDTIALLGAVFMVCFHLFIVSTFPLAVPLEWNVVFAFGSLFLFVGHPSSDGYGIFDFSQPWMLPVIAGGLLFLPVLGNLRPDLVSFLPSMRQYAGNWATAIWAFAPGCEARLNELDKPAKNQVDQLVAFGYEPGVAAHHAAGVGLAVDAQPGTWPLLPALSARRRGSLHGPGGRVRLQLDRRLELRRRPPARRGPDLRGPAAPQLRPGRAPGDVRRVAASAHEGPALPRHRRRAGRGGAGHVERARRGHHAALAARRPDPVECDLDAPRLRARCAYR